MAIVAVIGVLNAPVVAADISAEPLASKGEIVFSDDFNRDSLGDKWRVTTPTFVIADGVMKGSQTKEEHGAVARVNVGKKDLVIDFKFRLMGASHVNAVCNDRAYKDSHGSHICRVAIQPDQIFIGDDKERTSKAIEAMRKDPTRKAEVQKLIAGRSVSVPFKFEPDRWYQMSMEIVGDEMRVSVDDKPVGYLKSSGIDHPVKSDFHFTVVGKDALIDDMKIWVAQPK